MTTAKQNSNARFSVVTINLNLKHYLSETIESVLENLRPGDEYFIVDGGSTDGSVEVIRKYQKWLSGWISEGDRGYADAISKGFKHTKGELLCWLNSGDVLLKGALTTARDYLSSSDVDMIFGDNFYVDETGAVIFLSSAKTKSLKNLMLFGGWTPLQDACFWRRSLYDQVGGIDANLRYAADFDLFLRFAVTGRCRYVPAVFSAFRRHRSQKSIQYAAQYRTERESCRRRQIQELRISSARSTWNELLYGLAVRWRARVVDPLRRSRVLKGKQIQLLSCAPNP